MSQKQPYQRKTNLDTIIRIKLDDGKFATISNKVMMDTNLTSDAFRLITILLNNSEDWDIQVGFFSKKMNWDKKKTTAALKCLEINGYLTKIQKSKGAAGFEWTYTISELGNLKQEEKVIEESIQPTQPKFNNTNYSIEDLVDYFNSNNEDVSHIKRVSIHADIKAGVYSTPESVLEVINNNKRNKYKV